jgi:hypothetical protein
MRQRRYRSNSGTRSDDRSNFNQENAYAPLLGRGKCRACGLRSRDASGFRGLCGCGARGLL